MQASLNGYRTPLIGRTAKVVPVVWDRVQDLRYSWAAAEYYSFLVHIRAIGDVTIAFSINQQGC